MITATPPVRRRRRLGRRLATSAFLLLLAGLAAALLYLRAWPPMMMVMTSSMEPSIATGAVVVMRGGVKVPQVGDVVAVDVPVEARQEFGYPDAVLHRVVEVAPDGYVRTQGDNLADPDPFAVHATQISQRVLAIVPGAGHFIAFFTSPYGIAWVVIGLIVFFVMPFVDGQKDLRSAVLEYGYHLRSHTEVVKSMAAASQELAAVAEELRAAGAAQKSSRTEPSGSGSEVETPSAKSRAPERNSMAVSSGRSSGDALRRRGIKRPKGRHRRV